MKRFAIYIILLTTVCCKEEDSIDCIDPSKINEKAVCTYILQEVCGCNGKTYSNACIAENAGVVSWTEGRCE